MFLCLMEESECDTTLINYMKFSVKFGHGEAIRSDEIGGRTYSLEP